MKQIHLMDIVPKSSDANLNLNICPSLCSDSEGKGMGYAGSIDNIVLMLLLK